MNSPIPTYVLRSVEDCPECAVVDCHEQVCDPGVICGKHGDQIICQKCLSACEPYRAHVEWWQEKYWACDQCDAEIPGYVPACYWEIP